MTKIIEELQARVADAKLRLDLATKAFQMYQAAFQQAQQDHTIWVNALQAEVRDEQRRVTTVAEKLPSPTVSTSKPDPIPEPQVFIEPVDLVDEMSESLNKTDTVRDLLARHPAGMTAVDIWNEVSADFKHRPYLYSVLKRLRDRDEIVKRRNKYCLKLIPKPEEHKEQAVVN